MKQVIYLFSGILFGLGLCMSGMIDPAKVTGFLSFGFADWNPALIFVLGSAVPTYFIANFFHARHKRGGISPLPQKIDQRLVWGAVLFGIGWGIAGVCPGPALAHLTFLDMNFAVFILAMFAGFELQKRFFFPSKQST